MRVGLTLGKYAPLHNGHRHVIDTALGEVDHLIVLAYPAPEFTDVPLAVRMGWIRALYPQVEVLAAWGGPTDVGYDLGTIRRHDEYIGAVLAGRKVTHFYSSERYGEHVSLALGAVDRRVDEARQTVPISATKVRADPFGQRHHVPPLVYRDLITHVAIVGAPSTGKTTLAERLAREFATVWTPEFGRDYWHEHNVDRRLSHAQLLDLAQGHLALEEKRLQDANRYLFTDTNALTTAAFSLDYHGAVGSELETLAAAALTRYDLTILCDDDIPYDDTPDRSGAAHREAFQQLVVDDLRARRIPYVRVSGDLDERVQRVKSVLSGFRKYRSPYETNEGASE